MDNWAIQKFGLFHAQRLYKLRWNVLRGGFCVVSLIKGHKRERRSARLTKIKHRATHPLAWETREAQPVCAWWVGLAPGELPSWSQLLRCIVSMANLLKCSAFIAVFNALYYGMSICCQEDLSVVQWEGICRVYPILRRLNELGGFARGVDKKPQ